MIDDCLGIYIMMKKQIMKILYNLIGKESKSHGKADESETDSRTIHDSIPVTSEDIRWHEVVQQVVDQKTFEKIINISLAEEKGQGCLLIGNVDRFMNINDIYGHDTGDAVLQYVATVFRSVFGEGACIGSYGGDIFALWLPPVSRGDTVEIRRRVGVVNDKLLHPTKELPPVSLSVGVSFYEPGDDCRSLVKKANKALYIVKGSGRCGCEVSL